ncbi:ran/spi1 binding protein [Amylostereum chailletii]|nr:ran/spi1 binding protein [Amylostereum chailletii]
MADANENPLAPKEEEAEPHFEPVIQLTEQVETKTNEENEDAIFKMRAKLFRFDAGSNEWKERGTGEVRLLQHKETKKVRLVMRRDKTLKVCANHLVSSEMKLQPNIGSDRSWVWKVAADYSESPPTAETLAIRFANSDSESYAGQFKVKFEEAQAGNAKLTGDTETSAEEEQSTPPAESKPEEPVAEEAKAEPTEEKAEEEEKKEETA